MLVTLDQPLASGVPAQGCTHMASWLPVYRELMDLRGYTVTIAQAYGLADVSAGTHAAGTCLDIWATGDAVVAMAREGGAPATWSRGSAWGQDSMAPHTHIALDCPCASPADYQITAVKAGYDGLGYLGRGGRDYHPAPKVRRDWRAGIDWMREQIAQMEDIMATLDELRAVVRQEIMDAQIKREGPGASGTTTLRTTLAYLDGNLGRVLSGQAPAVLASALGGALASAGVVVADLDALAADVAKRLTVTAG